DVDKKDEAMDEARRNAVEKAQARADMYAKTLGMKVRRIVSISEGAGFGPPMPMVRGMMAMKAEAADTSVSPGENTLSVNLDVVFELGR
ncbi:MAG TPA: SIMPL domain-containing protein, partial [Lysobacter sp.]|nr:SIMPL domain-containing protein [Lysobacter sp.]